MSAEDAAQTPVTETAGGADAGESAGIRDPRRQVSGELHPAAASALVDAPAACALAAPAASSECPRPRLASTP